MQRTAVQRRVPPVIAAAIATVLAAVALGLPQGPGVSWSFRSVVVRAELGHEAAAADAILSAGGRIRGFVDLVDSFIADVPEPRVDALVRDPAVRGVADDYRLRFSSFDGEDGDRGDGDGSGGPEGSAAPATDDGDATTDEPALPLAAEPPRATGNVPPSYTAPPNADTFDEDDTTTTTTTTGTATRGSMRRASRAMNAQWFYNRGYTGRGIGVALIDSGVVPVAGLQSGVVNGPDISFDGAFPEARHLDAFGHGTHLGGIIAGDRVGDTSFRGVAPDATLVNVKVGSVDGTVDVSQVLAAIDWVVQRRADHNIRVLNLSFGTDGVQDYRTDPLTYAVERAWAAGIVVVVAAGNGSFGSDRLNNPAYDPYVLAVGAMDLGPTSSATDDSVPSWSARGDLVRQPDVVAPGRSIVSLRAPGSFLDERYPEARTDSGFFRGSGTSQAAAMVSGSVALMLQHRPQLTPDQVKELLRSTAEPIPSGDPLAQGRGMVDLRDAGRAPVPTAAVQSWEPATGVGLLELARGTVHVARDGVPLYGELTPLDATWNGSQWSGSQWSGSQWSGSQWSGSLWSGGGWTGSSWAGASWDGGTWLGSQWSGSQWSGSQWSGSQWSGSQWSGSQWSGSQWSGSQWSGSQWSGSQWSTAGWGT